MDPILDAALRSWPFDPWLAAILITSFGVYLRGWRVYRRRDPTRWATSRPTAFLAGLAAIYFALASPIEPFASLLLSVHMVQHLMLAMVAPPLLWLGHPLLPVIRGLPEPIRTYWVAPLFTVRWLRKFVGLLVNPVVAWVLFVGGTWVWHAPPLYDLALRDPAWHYAQHVYFLGSGMLFWFPVVRPYPFRPPWPIWVLLPYLLLADVSNTVLSALLSFSDQVIYPHYLQVPRVSSGSALDDQAVAGVIMWVPGSVAFLVPMFAIGLRWLFGDDHRPMSRVCAKPSPQSRTPARIQLPLAPSSEQRFDLLRVPILGDFLRWRYARPALQLPLLALAVLVVWDGLTGPTAASMNLAGVLPWIHWRGFLIIGLLAVGNVFCTACPFMLPRTLARKFLPSGRAWPRRLRSKWLAVGLVALFLVCYEAFALWDRPAVTAWIIVGYFTTALVIDGLFRGAVFCKYVCPIGQFNFGLSLASPMEVTPRDPAVCATCKTKDCIRGRNGIPGCELGLYLPHKHDNMDCTLCLDCVHACPSENVAIRNSNFGSRNDGRKRLIRPDVTVMVLVLVFGAFVNAAGMTEPALAWRDRLSTALGFSSPVPAVVIAYSFALVIVPSVAVGTATLLSQLWGKLPIRPAEVATRFAYSLVPIGFAMWLAHYGYHLVTSYDAAWPVFQRFSDDNGLAFLGTPDWAGSCCRPVGAWLPKLEILVLDVGLLLSLHAAYRTALHLTADQPRRLLAALAPWAALILMLFAVGVWVLLQPMEMRGTLVPG